MVESVDTVIMKIAYKICLIGIAERPGKKPDRFIPHFDYVISKFFSRRNVVKANKITVHIRFSYCKNFADSLH